MKFKSLEFFNARDYQDKIGKVVKNVCFCYIGNPSVEEEGYYFLVVSDDKDRPRISIEVTKEFLHILLNAMDEQPYKELRVH